MKIYLEGLGHRDTIKDHAQIIWFLKQLKKTMNKSSCTKFFHGFKKTYYDKLVESEAYEIISVVDKEVSKEKYEASQKAKQVARETADLEMQNFEIKHSIEMKMRYLFNPICPN
jgi:hypothetical protein